VASQLKCLRNLHQFTILVQCRSNDKKMTKLKKPQNPQSPQNPRLPQNPQSPRLPQNPQSPRLPRNSALFMMLLMLSLILADQFTKLCAIKFLPQPSQPIKILGDFLTFEKSLNSGIAFGLQIHPQVILILSVIIILFVLKIAKAELNFALQSTKWAFALILSGALGNILDRLTRGEVVDFIAFNFWPSFNLADAFIVVGVAIVLLFHKRILRRRV